jgi:hypothetical protein
MSKSKQIHATMDLYQSAYLLICGNQPDLENINGKIVFKFEVTDFLYHCIDLYNANADVQVADYVTAIKALRGQMLTLRGNGHKLK